MRLYLIISILLVGSASSGKNVEKVYYGWSNHVLPNQHQQKMYIGFEYALKHLLGKSTIKPDIVKKIDSDQSPIGAYNLITSIVREDPLLLSGFPSSHEVGLALKVPPIANGEVPLFSAGAEHSGILSTAGHIFSVAPSMDSVTSEMCRFLADNFKGKKGLVVYDNSKVYSEKLKDSFMRCGRSPLLRVFELSGDFIKTFHSSQSDFIVFLTYPNEIDQILEVMEAHKLDVPILGNSSWAVTEYDLFKHLLKWKRMSIYIPYWLRPESKKSSWFKSQFGEELSAELIFGYDLGAIVAEIYTKVKPLNRKNVIDFISVPRCYTTTITTDLCFPGKRGFANRKFEIKKLQLK